MKVHLLVSELYIYQTARCNDKNRYTEVIKHLSHNLYNIKNI